MSLKANCYATGIGSIPFTKAKEGLDFVIKHFPHIPFWPQLPNRSFLENMYAQYSENLPGVVIENEKIYLEKERAYDEMASFFENYLSGNLEPFAVSPEYAEGFYALMERSDDLENVAAI